jgi:transcriptional regulator with GAF, ATPase, and Fis domain
MATDRLLDIFSLMAARGVDDAGAPSMCNVAAEITQLDAAAISLTSEGDEITTLCISNHLARTLIDLEITLREGPAFEASTGGAVVQDVDLLASSAKRWMMYAPEAAAAGARAVFGFPVRIGAANFGALTLYRENPGKLSDAQTSDAYLMASVIARAVLAIQAGSPIGELAKELHGQSGLDFRVHQAAGMVAVQGSMSVKAALVLIRTHAFAEAMEISDLAEAIITRATRFEPASDSWITSTGSEGSNE